jgi:hypothetical protein
MSLKYACSQAVIEEEIEDLGCACNLEGFTGDINDLIDEATDVLYQISGGAVSGLCTNTYRPCSEGFCWCGFGPGCGCCHISGIPLPQPFPTVTAVKIDGVAFTDWAILDGYKLVRTDGLDWPGSKNPLLPDTEANTFSITVETGVDFNYASKMAAIELVCEMAAVISGREGMLPPGTVSATMDGISVQVGRLPGQTEVEAVGLVWLARYMTMWADTNVAQVSSPELSEGWTLFHVEFATP